MAAAETSGDDSDWAREAYHNSDLAAAILISFRGRSPEADDGERPSTSAPPAAMGSLEWGKRTKRSRWMRIPRISPLTWEGRKITEATAAVEAKVVNRKGKRRRASPQSPLEGYSSASASGGEEGTKAGRSTGGSIAAPEERRHEVAFPIKRPYSLAPVFLQVVTVAATNPQAPTVSRVVRRPSSKKLTKVELQAMRMSLLEENTKLLEEIGKWRKALEEMRVDNSKLKSFSKLTKPPVNNHTAEDVHQLEVCQPLAPSTPGRKDFLELPDLNDLPPASLLIFPE